jgi:hypothetical protein
MTPTQVEDLRRASASLRVALDQALEVAQQAAVLQALHVGRLQGGLAARRASAHLSGQLATAEARVGGANAALTRALIDAGRPEWAVEIRPSPEPDAFTALLMRWMGGIDPRVRRARERHTELLEARGTLDLLDEALAGGRG